MAAFGFDQGLLADYRDDACGAGATQPVHAFSKLLIDPWKQSRGLLSELIEAEIIPRLLKAHQNDHNSACTSITEAEVSAFSQRLLNAAPEELTAHARAFLARGITVETMLLDFFTPVARELGRYWEDDLSDFVEVTIGLCRLQQVLREIGNDDASVRRAAPLDCTALFTALPEDQHGFGAVVVEEMFARAGWTTERSIDATMPDLCAHVKSCSYDLLGLTVSCDVPIDVLPGTIRELRAASSNNRLVVMVGGPVFTANPALADGCGADGTASNALTAVIVAQTLVDEARSR